jgi:UDP-N-acetylglucosamine 2-epimerase (non-hydrolysing)
VKIVLVAGVRPNFMKIAPILRAIDKYNNGINRQSSIIPILVHTGQHYDYEMSQVFLQELELPKPDIDLEVGSGKHSEQTGKIMIEFEKILLKEKPDLVIVVGDVNSTLATALAAAKLHIPVAHVEAGLRSYDRNRPEEINRLLTDQISDYLFTPTPDADENLKKEGIAQERIFFVGNVMIDSLLYNKLFAEKSDILERLRLRDSSKLPIKPYALLTLHRPMNVDEKDSLTNIMNAITEISDKITVVFPVHPRTYKKLHDFNITRPSIIISSSKEKKSQILPRTNHKQKRKSLFNSQPQSKSKCQANILMIPPLGYLDFLNLMIHSKFVMTDSGSVQVETTILDIPCLTIVDPSGWPITCTNGTNVVVGKNYQKLIKEAFNIIDSQSDSKSQSSSSIPLWDGKTAERIVEIIMRSKLPKSPPENQ